jgi:hypothetical protein
LNRYNKVDMCKIIAKGLRMRGFRIHWLSFYGFPQIELKAFCDFLFSFEDPKATWVEMPKTFIYDEVKYRNWRRQIAKVGKFKIVRE